jgi:hypothetical protein
MPMKIEKSSKASSTQLFSTFVNTFGIVSKYSAGRLLGFFLFNHVILKFRDQQRVYSMVEDNLPNILMECITDGRPFEG